jgi:hypothetical protein
MPAEEMKAIVCRISRAEWTDNLVNQDEEGNAIHEAGIVLSLVEEKTGKVIPGYLSTEDLQVLARLKEPPSRMMVIQMAQMLDKSNARVKTVYDPNAIGLTRELIAIEPIEEEVSPASIMRGFVDTFEVATTDEDKVIALYQVKDLVDSAIEAIAQKMHSAEQPKRTPTRSKRAPGTTPKTPRAPKKKPQ